MHTFMCDDRKHDWASGYYGLLTIPLLSHSHLAKWLKQCVVNWSTQWNPRHDTCCDDFSRSIQSLLIHEWVDWNPCVSQILAHYCTSSIRSQTEQYAKWICVCYDLFNRWSNIWESNRNQSKYILHYLVKISLNKIFDKSKLFVTMYFIDLFNGQFKILKVCIYYLLKCFICPRRTTKSLMPVSSSGLV